jgi:ADP-ribose pyrophosphatase YjhB (NUDIX family)
MNITNATSGPIIRAASILIESGRICLIKQVVTQTRHWALPGGKVELGEKLSECITREFKEETGFDVQVRELLYVTDRIISDPQTHLVHMSFLVDRSGNKELPLDWKHIDPFFSSSNKTREIKMVSINELEKYGFSVIFCALVRNNFPGRGSYKGDFHSVYGE